MRAGREGPVATSRRQETASGVILASATPAPEAPAVQAVAIESGPRLVSRSPALALLRQLRPHHWVKNLLLLVPLLTAHRFADARSFRARGCRLIQINNI